jgi:hypothetical protein
LIGPIPASEPAVIATPASRSRREFATSIGSRVGDGADEVPRRGVHAVGGHERDVLEPVHARLDGLGDGAGAVGVCGDRQAVAVGLLDRGPQLGRAELGQLGVGAGGQLAAAGHQRDHVHAALGVLADGRPHAVDALGRAVQAVGAGGAASTAASTVDPSTAAAVTMSRVGAANRLAPDELHRSATTSCRAWLRARPMVDRTAPASGRRPA